MPGIADLRRRFQGGGMDAGAGSADRGFGAGVSRSVRDRMRDRDRDRNVVAPVVTAPVVDPQLLSAQSMAAAAADVDAGGANVFGGDGSGKSFGEKLQQANAQSLAKATASNNFLTGAGNIYNRFINNPYTQTTSQYTFNPGLALTFNPTKAGIGSAFIGLAGFNPQFEDPTDEESDFTSFGLFGSTYGGLKNALDPGNYEDVTKENFDAMLNAAFSPDPTSTKGYKVDFDAAEAEAQKLGFGPQFRFEAGPVYGEDKPFNPESSVVKDLEKNLGLDDGSIDNFKDFADAKRELDRKMGGGDKKLQPRFDPMTGEALPGATPGEDVDQATDTDTSPTYNDFTEAQKATVDKMTDILGYDMQYAIDYILGGGPTF